MQLVDITLAAFTWSTQWLDMQLPAAARLLYRNGAFHTGCGWATATVAKQWLGRDTSLWLSHWSNTQSYENIYVSHSTAHCKTKNQLASLESEVCDVRATCALPNHCMPVARTLVVCPHSNQCASSLMSYLVSVLPYGIRGCVPLLPSIQ
jgi:hypothetical protein